MMQFSARQLTVASAVGGIVVGAFTLGWWGSDDGSSRALTATSAAEWAPPKSIVSDISGYSKILAQRSPFGAAADRASPAPTPSQAAGPANAGAVQWRVGGIVVTETSRHLIVLIRRPGDTSARSEIRRPGEELPDGSILRTIEPTNVTIDRQGTIVRIKMFAQN